jgi:hypothetical protein
MMHQKNDSPFTSLYNIHVLKLYVICMMCSLYYIQYVEYIMTFDYNICFIILYIMWFNNIAIAWDYLQYPATTTTTVQSPH